MGLLMNEKAIYVAVYVARLETPWAKSLKEKRALILPITEKLKSRFPVSVARLAGLNNLDWEEIGVSAISADRVWLEQTLTKVDNFISGQDALLTESEQSIERWDIS